MTKDKKKLYLISLILLAVLLVSFFAPTGSSKIAAACILVPFAFIVWLFIKKRGSVSINKGEVLLLLAVVGALYVVLMQLTGFIFEFYENPYFVNQEIFFRAVVPLTAIIIAIEIIRHVMLMQKNKVVDVLIYLSGIAVDVLMFSNLSSINSFNNFMDLVGLTLFPAISANVFYNFVSRRYGMLPNIAYRLITTLYVYLLPTTTGISEALHSCIKIVMPIVLLALVMAMFEKKKKNAVRKGRKLSVVGIALSVAVIVSVAMLISCQFRFGALVIATDSMTGEINKGDMIIYEQYDDQNIQEGQVIVFEKNENKIVHRVIRIENIGGEVRYYTKGDANADVDEGYIGKEAIVGVTDFKLAYLGYPALWLREMIKTN
ncbi:MAG: signal peptidase I [Ruminococcaceae bacterium]|nr:signal peptidase I [Oscillospiraceae bacterium]